MKILIAIPTHVVKDYCTKAAMKAISSLKLPGQEIIIRYDPNEYGSKNSCKMQREWFRQYAVDNNFDYLYFMGWDNPVTQEQIEKLLQANRDIIGGVYWTRKVEGNEIITPVVWTHDLSQIQRSELMKSGNGIQKVDGMGMDAVLFTKKAFTSFKFLEWTDQSDDHPAYDILKSRGFDIYVDTEIQIPHYATGSIYTLNGKIINK